MKKVFVSHAIKDKAIIDWFVDDLLVGVLNIKTNDIFCISTEGMKIKSGEDWRNQIRENIISAEIIFLIITPHFKQSEVCLNEMGAAWVSSGKVFPLITEPINFRTVGVIQESNQIEKLLEETSLDRIKDEIQVILKIPAREIQSDRWTSKKKEFIRKVNKHIQENPFPTPLDNNTFEATLKENKDLNTAYNNLLDEKMELEALVKDLKKAKNKEEVKAIEKKHGFSSDFDEFKEIVDEINSKLKKFHPIIQKIIYKSFSGSMIKIDWDIYEAELGEAQSRQFIDEDMNADFDTTNHMKELHKLLLKINKLINISRRSNEFPEEFQEEYNIPMDLKNLNFWEDVFKAKIPG